MPGISQVANARGAGLHGPVLHTRGEEFRLVVLGRLRRIEYALGEADQQRLVVLILHEPAQLRRERLDRH